MPLALPSWTTVAGPVEYWAVLLRILNLGTTFVVASAVEPTMQATPHAPFGFFMPPSDRIQPRFIKSLRSSFRETFAPKLLVMTGYQASQICPSVYLRLPFYFHTCCNETTSI